MYELLGFVDMDKKKKCSMVKTITTRTELDKNLRLAELSNCLPDVTPKVDMSLVAPCRTSGLFQPRQSRPLVNPVPHRHMRRQSVKVALETFNRDVRALTEEFLFYSWDADRPSVWMGALAAPVCPRCDPDIQTPSICRV